MLINTLFVLVLLQSARLHVGGNIAFYSLSHFPCHSSDRFSSLNIRVQGGQLYNVLYVTAEGHVR